MSIVAMSLLAAAAAALQGASGAQEANELRLFSRGNFAGSSISATGPRQGIGPFTAKSVQMPAGTSWELCSGETFSKCKLFSGSDPAMVMTVRSVRPVAAPITGPIAARGGVAPPGPGMGPTIVAANGGSLRGLASEFFVTPGVGAGRVPASQSNMSNVATEFCRQHGWRTSVHARLQSVSGQTYLADVLCADEQ